MRRASECERGLKEFGDVCVWGCVCVCVCVIGFPFPSAVCDEEQMNGDVLLCNFLAFMSGSLIIDDYFAF